MDNKPKIADFGSATTKLVPGQSIKGTKGYMRPESKHLDELSDAYSVGVTVFQMHSKSFTPRDTYYDIDIPPDTYYVGDMLKGFLARRYSFLSSISKIKMVSSPSTTSSVSTLWHEEEQHQQHQQHQERTPQEIEKHLKKFIKDGLASEVAHAFSDQSRRLGHGNHAVTKCTIELQNVAIKKLPYTKESPNSRRKALKEVFFLDLCSSSDYVVNFFGWCEDKPNHSIYLAMHCCPYGNLKEWITKPDVLRSEKELFDMTMGILKGILFIHSLGIIHNDIKPENILVCFDNKPKVADFGSATHSWESGQILGTKGYKCPELEHLPPDKLSDAYSVGVTLFQLYSKNFTYFDFYNGFNIPDHTPPVIKGTLEGFLTKRTKRVLISRCQLYLTTESYGQSHTEHLKDCFVQGLRQKTSLPGNDTTKVTVRLKFQEVDIKRIPHTTFKQMQKALQEVRFTEKCSSSDYVINFFAWDFTNDAVFLATPFYADKLSDWISQNRITGRLDIVKGIVIGIVFLHHNDVIHNDIKPENIVIATGGEAVVPKITNFSAATPRNEYAAELIDTLSFGKLVSQLYPTGNNPNDLDTIVYDVHTVGDMLNQMLNSRITVRQWADKAQRHWKTIDDAMTPAQSWSMPTPPGNTPVKGDHQQPNVSSKHCVVYVGGSPSSHPTDETCNNVTSLKPRASPMLEFDN